MSDQDQDNLDLYGPDDVNDEALYGEEEIDASLDTYQPEEAPAPTPAPAVAAPPPAPVSTLPHHPSLPPIPRLSALPPAPPPSSLNHSGGGASHGGGSYGIVAGAGLGSAAPPAQSNVVRPSDMEGEGKMFVGGLNWETTDAKLKDYFSQFGAIDACTIMRDGTGRSRGFAFLTFVESASVDKVLSQMHTVDGKPIDPKRAIPHDEHRKAAKIFVGGLHASTTIETLRAFFSQFGQVLDAQVMLDRESSRSKGFGFVTFADEDACEKCLALGMMEIEGKQVEVKKAQPRGGRDANGGGNDRRGGGGGGASGGNGPQSGLPGQSASGTYTPMPMYGAGASVSGGAGGGMGAGFGMAGMMPGMGAPGMGGPGMGGPVDPNQMANFYRMMSAGMGAGMPGMTMGRPGQPPMMNPQFMMPGFNPMMGGGSPMAGMNGMRPPMGMPMGMMGMRPPMGMGMGMGLGMGGMMGMGGMPFMGMPGQPMPGQGPPGGQGANGNSSASLASISATPMRQTGSRSPNTATGGAGGGQQSQQGPGPARSNTRGQSHFKPY